MDSEAWAWATLHAAGLTATWRDAVAAAGGPVAVWQAGEVFDRVRGQVRMLDVERATLAVKRLQPFVEHGGQVWHDARKLGPLLPRADPLCLYVQGPGSLVDDVPRVGIVGARACSVEGAAHATGSLESSCCCCTGRCLKSQITPPKNAIAAPSAVRVRWQQAALTFECA